ncbi:unnamed protein product [Paramecium primaurelia]|uniref:Cytochrome P450 n=1 Tax=Paramecium primaurelia TaxID=5886 RepID=A0A8S1LS41_PARPR|nr:unnamed protein product [Paramecium primaurelia]
MMLFWILSFLSIPLLWIILYPLCICYFYKFKHGNKVYILYFPLLGQFKYRIDGVRFQKDVIYFKRNIAYNYPEVELIITHIFSRPYFIFIKPEKVKQMLYNYTNYKKRTDEIFRDIIACKGLVYAEGQQWKDQKRELSNFFTFESLSSKIPVIKLLIQETLQYQDNQRVNIIKQCARIAQRTMQICFFNQIKDEQINGQHLSEEFQDLSKYFIYVTYGSLIHQMRCFFGIKSLSTMKSYFMTAYEKQFLQRVYGVRNYINNLINNYQKGSDKDVFSILMRDPLSEDVREQIIHQYITFVFAGMDTTSHQAGMSIYMLAKHPQIQERLREELNKINFEEIDQKLINSLPLLNAFVNECLRTQTPSDGIIPRLSVKDHYVGEYLIKKDWYVDAGLQPMMTHPQYFENHLDFNLERWLNQSEPEAFLPFSYGPRNCLGQHLAKIEIKLILIYIMKTYKVILDDQTNLIMECNFLYAPQDDRLVKFIRI